MVPLPEPQSYTRWRATSLGSRISGDRRIRSRRACAACAHRNRSSSIDFPFSFPRRSGSRSGTGVGDRHGVESRPGRGARWAAAENATIGPPSTETGRCRSCLANGNHDDSCVHSLWRSKTGTLSLPPCRRPNGSVGWYAVEANPFGMRLLSINFALSLGAQVTQRSAESRALI